MGRKINLKKAKQLIPTKRFRETFRPSRGCKYYDIGFKRSRMTRPFGVLNVMVVYASGHQAAHPTTYHKDWFHHV